MTPQVCPKGHPMTPENTYVNPSRGERMCRECRRIAKRAYRKTPQGKAALTRNLIAWAKRQEAK